MSVDLSAARPYTAAVAVAGVSATAMVLGAALLSLPLRDPDGLLGPAYLRLPVFVVVFLVADVLPRTLWCRRAAGGVCAAYRQVVRDRWSGERLVVVAVGLVSFYVTYVAYRNIKGYVPFVRSGLDDRWMLQVDQAMFLGHPPSAVLHAVLGTGLAAHVLSTVYVAFFLFVPLSLAAGLVWSRDVARGAWYVTSMGVAWAVGGASYYLVPTLGPAYARPGLFSDLPATNVSGLQRGLLRDRVQVLTDPWATHVLHGIGAFASLHVAIVLTAALIAHRMRLAPWIRGAMWVYLGLTTLSTVYFGWHYVLDDVAGAGIGWFSVWLGGIATGQHGAPAVTERTRELVPS